MTRYYAKNRLEGYCTYTTSIVCVLLAVYSSNKLNGIVNSCCCYVYCLYAYNKEALLNQT